MNSMIGNDYALKYKTEEELQKGIDNYFKECDKLGKPYTMSGLALSLELDRKTLLNYSNREKYSPLIKKAKAKVETMLEENLYRVGNNSGIIFNLKNNYGWRDQIEVQNTEVSKLDTLLEEIEKDANK